MDHFEKCHCDREVSCAICGGPVQPWPHREGEQPAGFGHNPDPLAESGRACDFCNNNRVIPARLAALTGGTK